jgi:hypothetical protein
MLMSISINTGDDWWLGDACRSCAIAIFCNLRILQNEVQKGE